MLVLVVNMLQMKDHLVVQLVAQELIQQMQDLQDVVLHQLVTMLVAQENVHNHHVHLDHTNQIKENQDV